MAAAVAVRGFCDASSQMANLMQTWQLRVRQGLCEAIGNLARGLSGALGEWERRTEALACQWGSVVQDAVVRTSLSGGASTAVGMTGVVAEAGGAGGAGGAIEFVTPKSEDAIQDLMAMASPFTHSTSTQSLHSLLPPPLKDGRDARDARGVAAGGARGAGAELRGTKDGVLPATLSPQNPMRSKDRGRGEGMGDGGDFFVSPDGEVDSSSPRYVVGGRQSRVGWNRLVLLRGCLLVVGCGSY